MKLLIGGSPCTHWSIAQTKNRETEAIDLEHGAAATSRTVKGLGRDWSWESYYNEFMANKEFEDAQITFDELFPDSPGGCLCGAPCGCYDG